MNLRLAVVRLPGAPRHTRWRPGRRRGSIASSSKGAADMRCLGIAMLMACAALPAFGQGAVPGDPASGQAIAQAWCANCHAIARNGAAASDSVPGFPAIADRPGLTADGLRAFLSEPHGRMPNLALSRNDIDNAIAYILALRTR